MLDETADDGFDSETLTATPVSSRNDYYNSSEHIWLKRDQYENFTEPSPARGNSESLGSLSTDASEHDYYNDFHPPVKSDQVFLNSNGTATSVMWTARFHYAAEELRHWMHVERCVTGAARYCYVARSAFDC